MNLVFALDGLVNPGDWKGRQHRKYISALLSGGDAGKFETVLDRYDHLYTEVRNKLVHEGKDFYQLPDNPDDACETIYQYIKDIIVLIEEKDFAAIANLKAYAQLLLQSQPFIEVINRMSTERGK